MRTVFDNFLELPKKSIEPSSAQVVSALNKIGNSSQIQQEINYASASLAEKQAESILKIQQSKTADRFSSLSKNLSVNQNDNTATVIDTSTRTNLYDLPEDLSGNTVPIDFRLRETENKTNELKVKLTAQPFNETIVFEAMPTISENRNVAYDEFTPLHHPGDILKYKSTSARSWSISAKLISRNTEEATKNLKIINTIRAWAMPFYGVGTERDKSTSQYLGGPPPILTLSAYGKMMVGPISCVLESYSWEFPNSIDYLPAYPDGPNTVPTPFPVILSVSLNLKESLSPAEYSGFDLIKFKNGELPSAFSAVSANRQESVSTYPSQLVPSSISNELARVPADARTIFGARGL
jgi:hypothetical protein